MVKIVTVETKKDFLKRFLRTYQLKNIDCGLILTFFMANDSLLNKVHFVEDINGYSRGLFISAVHTNHMAFRYQRGDMSHTNVVLAFRDIRLNIDEEIYIQLNFTGQMEFPSYLAVLEKQPLTEQINDSIREVSYGIKKEAIAFMALMEELYLQKEINRALDEKNPTLFKKIINKK